MNKAFCIKTFDIYKIVSGSIYEYKTVSMGDGIDKFVFKIDNSNLRNELHLHPRDFDTYFMEIETYRDNLLNSLINE